MVESSEVVSTEAVKEKLSPEYWRNRAFFWLAFVILVILTLLMIKPYFTMLVLSLIAVIMLTPLYDYFMQRHWVNKRQNVAVTLTLVSFLGVLVVPIYFVVRLVIEQLAGAVTSFAAVDLDATAQSISEALGRWPINAADVLGAFQSLAVTVGAALTDLAISLGSSLPDLMIQGLLFVVIVAALLPRYKSLVTGVQRISPLGYDISELYSRKITAMVSSLVKGVFLIAILQGAAMGVFYWLAGLPYIFLLVVVSMLLAMIPIVGISWLVIGIVIVSFLTGNYVQGLIVLGGFYGVVNWIDVLLRPKLLSKEANLPVALFLLSIFGGLAWAGAMGLFYGPVIMLLLITTIQIYVEKYAHEDGVILSAAIEGLMRGRDEEEEFTEEAEQI